MATAVVVLGGSVGPQTVPADAYSAEVVVAADGGLDVANALGIDVDRVVGDLDSVSPGALDAALAAGMPIERHAVDKDETDFELAVQSALRDPVDRLVVLGGAGGRIDHLLGNMAVLCGISGSGIDVSVEAWVGDTLVIPLTGRWQRSFPSDTLVSLLAWGGPAVVTAEGLRWPLDAERLEPTSSRGISNRTLAGPCRIDVHEGTLLVVVPSAPSTGVASRVVDAGASS